jgi:quinolinate synthase
VILWDSACGVHTIFTPAMVAYWKDLGWAVLVHPEAPLETVLAADGQGSTNYLWTSIMDAPRGARFAIGTEGHFVRNAREQAALRGVEVRHLAEVPGSQQGGCGCATMSRHDPPHLAGTLALLRLGRAPSINRALPGDTVD